MNSLVVVLAALCIGSNANLIPLTYTGLPSTVLTHGGIRTYTVQPQVQKLDQVTQIINPVHYTGLSTVSQAVVPNVPTQYVAQLAVPNTVQSQFHQQDELGAYHFGHFGGPFSKQESRDHAGNVVGSYNFIDSEGQVQTAHYTAGPGTGFKVAATHLPVAPVAPVAPAVELPTPVADTPAVADAKLAFKAAFDKAVADSAAKVADAPADTSAVATPVRRKRSTTPVVAVHGSAINPLQYTALLPNQFNTFSHFPLGFTQFRSGLNTIVSNPLINSFQPVLYNAPATTVQNAELLRVTNNPGHGVSYRVLH